MPGPKYSRENPQPRGEDADYQDQMFGQGNNPRPTNAPMAPRPASPAEHNTSGMERALGQMADKVHPVRKR